MQSSLDQKVREVAARDGRYSVGAYHFIYEALTHTLKIMDRKGHVTGKELLEGIRDLAIEQFGGLATMVFENWGLRGTRDFGNIVFNLVEAGLMGKTPNDCLEDFDDVYEFRRVFTIDALPRSASASPEA